MYVCVYIYMYMYIYIYIYIYTYLISRAAGGALRGAQEAPGAGDRRTQAGAAV